MYVWVSMRVRQCVCYVSGNAAIDSCAPYLVAVDRETRKSMKGDGGEGNESVKLE